MVFVTSRLAYSVVFYALVIALLILAKPSLVFKKDGKPKPFGMGRNETIFAFGTATVVLAILCFYAFAWIDLVFGH
jgi:Co/Zn/Cd efflux system component